MDVTVEDLPDEEEDDTPRLRTFEELNRASMTLDPTEVLQEIYEYAIAYSSYLRTEPTSQAAAARAAFTIGSITGLALRVIK